MQIADDFNRPLDALCDGFGNLLVAEVGLLPGTIYRVLPENPIVGTHAFDWDSDADGNWSDRLSWDSGVPSTAERFFPNEWGDARYDVAVDRPGASPLITVDRDVRVETLSTGDRLRVGSASTLTVRAGLTVELEGELSGDGSIVGDVSNLGATAPGASLGTLSVTGDFGQSATGNLLVEVSGTDDHDVLAVSGTAVLAGLLTVALTDGFIPSVSDSFTVVTAGQVTGTFDTVTAPAGLTVTVDIGPADVVLTVISVSTSVGPNLRGQGILHLASRNPVQPGQDTLVLLEVPPPGTPVRLFLSDVAGRRVLTVHDGFLAGGKHSVVLSSVSADELSAGVYFLRLEAPTGSESLKLVLLK